MSVEVVSTACVRGRIVTALTAMVVVFFVTACTTGVHKKFAETTSQIQAAQTIDILIDTFVLSDIKGDKLGYNKEKNNLAASELERGLVELLTARGYKPRVIFAGSRYQQDIEDAEIVYSRDWQSLEKSYPGSVVISGDPGWLQSDATRYFDEAIIEAQGALTRGAPLESKKARQERRERLGLIPEQVAVRKAVLQNPPSLVSDSNADLMLFVRYANMDIPTGKKLGLGLLYGAATLAVSGGTMVGVMMFQEKGPMTVSLLDTSTGQLVWGNDVADTAHAAGESAKITSVLRLFPRR